jgi:hypothetical protein
LQPQFHFWEATFTGVDLRHLLLHHCPATELVDWPSAPAEYRVP